MSERINYIDVAKGIGIALVVVGHCTIGTSLFNFIYQFHMPFFFFLSGTLYKNEYDTKPLLFIKKKLKGLYIPYIKYSAILIIAYSIYYYAIYHAFYYENIIKIVVDVAIGFTRPHLG